VVGCSSVSWGVWKLPAVKCDFDLTNGGLDFSLQLLFSIYMTTSLLDEAIKVIPNQQVLINVVSKRVRQLTQGHRPMVEVGARLDYADIALREIIEGKISYEFISPDDEAAA